MKISTSPKRAFCHVYTKDTVSNWASLGFGGKHFTEKKQNYFKNKVQEKIVSKQDFQDGKENHVTKKTPKT